MTGGETLYLILVIATFAGVAATLALGSLTWKPRAETPAPKASVREQDLAA